MVGQGDLESGEVIVLARAEVVRSMRLHVLLACHNRRDLTVRAITNFAGAASKASLHVDFTVFDDGSTDGTAEALAALKLPVTCIAGDGSAFWSRSMARAEEQLLSTCDDGGYVVWLNDDVELDGDALEVALAASNSAPSAVLVGAMRDPATGQVTYSGYRRRGFHPLRFVTVEPNGALQSIDTFNGNLVFVPLTVARAVGGIDGSFSHFGADTDYGFRVRDSGYELLLLPRIVGSCPQNPPQPRGSALRDWRAFVGVKGGGNYNTLRRTLQKRHPLGWRGYVYLSYFLWWARRLTPRTVFHFSGPAGVGGQR